MMPSVSGNLRPLLVAACLILASGCTFTKLETARQLEASETVYSASADFVGFGPIPRVQVNAMRGVGGTGDVSAHLGTTIFSANAGVGGRLYLGDYLNLSLQADAMTLLIDLGFGTPMTRFERFVVTGTPRLTTAVHGDQFFYGGFQSNVITGLQPGQAELLGVAAGLLAGIDVAQSGGGFQIELIVYPISYQNNRVVYIGDMDDATVLAMQLSLGIYFR